MSEGYLAEEAPVPAPERPAPAGPPAPTEQDLFRIHALGDELVRIHDGLRQELAAVREGIRERLDGQAAEPGAGPATPLAAARPAAGLTRQLRERCLSFCGGLGEHHTGEDTLGFPRLEREFPELRPAITRLREEHVVVARISGDLQALLAEPGSGDLPQVQAGVEQLSSDLEGHFAYEEEQLVDILNKLTTPPEE